MEKTISVIIPVKNGESTLKRCLESIKSQTISGQVEIIALDSESTDKSREILSESGATIINIPQGTFNHGLTRANGVDYAKGDFLFYTVQDAYLSEDDLLEKMVDYFQDETVQAVVGHQAVPHEYDKNPLLWFKRFSEPISEVRYFPDQQFDKLPLKKKVALAAWDDVVAMYRKTALVQQPFTKTDFAEDCIWCYQALSRGWKLIYAPELVVYHYHHRNFSYSFKVAFAVNYHFYLFFKYHPSLPPVFLPMAKSVYHIAKNKAFSFEKKIYWIWHNLEGLWGTFWSHAYFKSILFFRGGDALKNAYNVICKNVPIGKQKNE